MKQYSGKTLDDLLVQAANDKSVGVEDLFYYIIEEKNGFLGFGATVTAEVFGPNDVSNFVVDYLEKFFRGLDQEVTIRTSVTRSRVNVELESANNAILIGRQGSSLDGLNALLRHSVSAHFKRKFFVDLDINNYKRDRHVKLKGMAQAFAETVVRTKVAVKLDPMPNDERRIIHKELTGVANIKTESQGSGRYRHLVIKYKE